MQIQSDDRRGRLVEVLEHNQQPGAYDCFVEGTPVETADGLVPIDQVQQGDLVWAKDPETGVSALREVTRTYVVRHDISVLALEFAIGDGAREVLTTTAEHPFWVKHQGFVPAEELMPGDEMFTSLGGWCASKAAPGLPTRARCTIWRSTASTPTLWVRWARGCIIAAS